MHPGRIVIHWSCYTLLSLKVYGDSFTGKICQNNDTQKCTYVYTYTHMIHIHMCVCVC